jgi:hypothetical protein
MPDGLTKEEMRSFIVLHAKAAGAPVDERAAFEAWAEGETYPVDKYSNGSGYLDRSVSDAWEAWQARAALQQPVIHGEETLEQAYFLAVDSVAALQSEVDEWRAKYDSLIQQPGQADKVPGGWKLVPITPTEDMADAGMAHTADPCWKENVKDAYRAMLAAAPSPQDKP